MKLSIVVILTIYFIICQVALSTAGEELDRWIISKASKKYLRKINHDETRISILARFLSIAILERCKSKLTDVDLSNRNTEKIVDESVYAFIRIAIEDLVADLSKSNVSSCPARKKQTGKWPFLRATYV